MKNLKDLSPSEMNTSGGSSTTLFVLTGGVNTPVVYYLLPLFLVKKLMNSSGKTAQLRSSSLNSVISGPLIM